AQGANEENARLRKLLDMDERLTLEEQGLVEARVYGRSPTVWYSTVTVNKGTRDGVREGDAVINGAGLVGRVRRASGGSSQVVLITDGDMGISAKINETGFPGIVETAVGSPNDLRLNFLPRNAEPQEGQTVVTSGSTSERFPSFFPEGIPIGRITDVDEDEGSVRLRPFAQLRRVDLVQIVTEPEA
ncbi:MAG TPA: rod shape-determining protein MreC, partial [Solirubrobacteraceae bacterium]|nr:rod shape-determining protein MreC [Solirubrobacteraceae bacterium]